MTDAAYTLTDGRDSGADSRLRDRDLVDRCHCGSSSEELQCRWYCAFSFKYRRNVVN